MSTCTQFFNPTSKPSRKEPSPWQISQRKWLDRRFDKVDAELAALTNAINSAGKDIAGVLGNTGAILTDIDELKRIITEQ